MPNSPYCRASASPADQTILAPRSPRRALLGSLARSVNETSLLNTTDQSSSIDFVWVQGTYHATLSLQLIADANTSDFFPNPYAVDGIDRGALVHFSEDNARTNDTATTPWIAFISCDRCVPAVFL